MSDLTVKHCPFCGAAGKLIRISNGNGDVYRVKCSDCEACTGWAARKADAIEKWNRREK